MVRIINKNNVDITKLPLKERLALKAKQGKIDEYLKALQKPPEIKSRTGLSSFVEVIKIPFKAPLISKPSFLVFSSPFAFSSIPILRVAQPVIFITPRKINMLIIILL